MKDRMHPATDYETRKHVPFESKQGSVKWWDLKPYKGGQQWTTFDHNGVLFPELYEPHGVKMLYNGMPLNLTPDQEEIATWFADILETDHAENPTFCKNFFADWQRVLRSTSQARTFPKVLEFSKCNFRPIYGHRQREKEKMKEMRKEADYKAEQKAKKAEFERTYGFCLVDGSLDKVANCRVEPPGLFRGRGKHPKTGMVKKRLVPEDIILNISKEIPIPECPVPGHNWGGVIHDNTVTYIAKWIENINGQHKMIYLHSSSRFKGQSDMAKFGKARKLKGYIQPIRKSYIAMLQSNTRSNRQLATAVWMIDILSIRVGNEKDTEEAADTVGVCSLRVEHVTLFPKTEEIELDFLGKDSMRYYNKIKFPFLVYRNMERFVKHKKPDQQLFEEIDSGAVNCYLNKLMVGLSAKVFRTHNASVTLQKELDKAFDGSKIPEIGYITKDSTVDQKKFFYDKANTRVAILCNHQKSVSKGHGEQMEKLENKMKEAKKKLARLKKELSWAKGKTKPPKKEKWKKKTPVQIKAQIENQKARINKYDLTHKLKGDNKEVALGTSKINYMDPRITVAFCKKLEVPLEKIFNKSIIEKFPWACAEKPDFRF